MSVNRRQFIQGTTGVAAAATVPSIAATHELTAGTGEGLAYRPWTYGPQGRAVWPRYGGLSGRRRVAEVQNILSEHASSWGSYTPQWASRLAHEELTAAERRAWCESSRDWPWFQKTHQEGPVEIASIRLLSIHGETLSVRAEPTAQGYRYTIHEEYDDTIIQPFEFSSAPLTLTELIRFINGSHYDGDCFEGGLVFARWQSSYEGELDPVRATQFTRIRSIFYPGLQSHYAQVAERWIAERTEEDVWYEDHA